MHSFNFLRHIYFLIQCFSDFLNFYFCSSRITGGLENQIFSHEAWIEMWAEMKYVMGLGRTLLLMLGFWLTLLLKMGVSLGTCIHYLIVVIFHKHFFCLSSLTLGLHTYLNIFLHIPPFYFYINFCAYMLKSIHCECPMYQIPIESNIQSW